MRDVIALSAHQSPPRDVKPTSHGRQISSSSVPFISVAVVANEGSLFYVYEGVTETLSTVGNAPHVNLDRYIQF